MLLKKRAPMLGGTKLYKLRKLRIVGRSFFYFRLLSYCFEKYLGLIQSDCCRSTHRWIASFPSWSQSGLEERNFRRNDSCFDPSCLGIDGKNES